MGERPSLRELLRGDVVVLLALVILLGLVPRMLASRASLWVDELHTSWVVADGLGQVAERARISNQSPLYFYIQWGLGRVLPPSELSLRLLSLLSGLGLLAGLVLITFQGTRSYIAALLTGIAAALDENFVFYASEARPYALVQLVALVQIALTIARTTPASLKYRAAWCLLTALLFHLHYTTALLIGAEVLLVGVGTLHTGWVGRDWRPWRAFFVNLLIVGLLLAPALPHALDVGARRAAWSSFVTPRPLWHVLTMFHAARYLVPAFAAAALSRWLRSDSKLSYSSCRAGAFWLSLFWLLPVGLAWLLTTSGLAPLFHNRYLIAVATIPLVLAACCWARARPPLQWGFGAALVVAILFADGYVQWTRGRMPEFMRREDWRGLIAALNERTFAEDPVLVRSGLIEAEQLGRNRPPQLRAFCLSMFDGLYGWTNRPAVVEPLAHEPPFNTPPGVRTAIANEGGVWIVWRGDARRRPRLEQALLRELADGAGFELRADQRQMWGTLRLTHFRVVEPAPDGHR